MDDFPRMLAQLLLSPKNVEKIYGYPQAGSAMDPMNNKEYADMSDPKRLMLRWASPDPYTRMPVNKWDVQNGSLNPSEMNILSKDKAIFDFFTNYGIQGP